MRTIRRKSTPQIPTNSAETPINSGGLNGSPLTKGFPVSGRAKLGVPVSLPCANSVGRPGSTTALSGFSSSPPMPCWPRKPGGAFGPTRRRESGRSLRAGRSCGATISVLVISGTLLCVLASVLGQIERAATCLVPNPLGSARPNARTGVGRQVVHAGVRRPAPHRPGRLDRRWRRVAVVVLVHLGRVPTGNRAVRRTAMIPRT